VASGSSTNIWDDGDSSASIIGPVIRVGSNPPSSSRREMRLHVTSQNGVNSRLITFLPSERSENIGVQADRNRFLRRWHDNLCAFPEISIGRLHLRIATESLSDLTIGHGPKLLPIATLLGGCYSSMLLFHVALPSRPR
jgi:hypothetical protein